MGSETKNDTVEIIDLTNETTNVNTTITLDDSHAIELESIEPRNVSRDDVDSDDSSGDIFGEPINWSVDDEPIELSQDAYQTPQASQRSHVSEILEVLEEPRVQKGRTKKTVKPKTSRSDKKKETQLRKEEERLQKEVNRANAANKALDNCVTHIDRGVLPIINDTDEVAIRTLFDESLLRYTIEDDQKIRNSITWSYKRAEIEHGTCITRYKNAKWIIIVMEGSEYLKLLLTYRDKPNDTNSLKTFLSDVRERTECDIVLFVCNLANHLKSERMKEAKNYRKTFKDRFEGASRGETSESEQQTVSNIGPNDLQDMRLMFEIEYKHQNPKSNLLFEFLDKTSNIVQALTRYSSSIAKYEIKSRTIASTDLDWAINMDKERAVDPTKSVEDLTKLWITQLQQFSQITLPIAKAIAAEYPSPCALLDQYENLTPSEAEDLLADLHVQRNLRRQIGPNISKRIYRFMTCSDPNVHIGLD